MYFPPPLFDLHAHLSHCIALLPLPLLACIICHMLLATCHSPLCCTIIETRLALTARATRLYFQFIFNIYIYYRI